MKKLLLLLLLIPFFGESQSEPQRKDNVIYISGANISAGDITNILANNDYDLDINDTVHFRFTTKSKNFKSGEGTYYFKIRKVTDNLELTGFFNLHTNVKVGTPLLGLGGGVTHDIGDYSIEYRKSKLYSNSYGYCFTQMQNIANDIAKNYGGQISYGVK